MSRLLPLRPHGPLDGHDLRYVEASYFALEVLAAREAFRAAEVRAWVEAGHLPRPAYLLPDGQPMFPGDLLSPVRAAGGIEALQAHVACRLEAAARLAGAWEEGRTARDWEGYLSGEYGVCLRQVTPEALVLKEVLVERMEEHLAEPHPEDAAWRRTMALDIRGLDALLRPFARADEVRFGRPSSRARLVEAPRRRWPWLAGRPSRGSRTAGGIRAT